MLDAGGNAYFTGNYEYTVFVLKVDTNGNVLWSKRMASSRGWDSGYGLALDAAGSVYVGGYAGHDFPTTPGAFQTTCNSSMCGFVAKIDAGFRDVARSDYAIVRRSRAGGCQQH